MNKKFIAIISTLSLCVSMTACTNKNNTNITNNEPNTTTSTITLEPMKDKEVGEINTFIELGDTINIDGEGVVVKDKTITIKSAGVYSLTGKLDEGQIIVDAGNEDDVFIVLNGVDITNSNTSPIYSKNSKNTIISLQDNTKNTLTDGEEYKFEDSTDEPNATIFSKNDLYIIGSGSLIINANYNHGIYSKDEFKIQSGDITINSKNDGIKGKDCVNIAGGNINIVSGGDGIQSNNTTDETKGYILIEDGNINISAGEDGIQAETNLQVKDGTIDIVSGGGSESNTNLKNSPTDKNNFRKRISTGGTISTNSTVDGQIPLDIPKGLEGQEPPEIPAGMEGQTPPDIPQGLEGQQPPELPSNEQHQGEQIANNTTQSTVNEISKKGIKAGGTLAIDGGKIKIDSYDDSIHTNNIVGINNGEIEVSSGDDGIHSDKELSINGGKIDILNSYEGIESEILNFNGGETHLKAVDDGLNASSSSNNQSAINITNGYLYVDASGDGIDSNGNIDMDNGTVIVNGPVNGGNGYLDYDGIFNLNGGVLISSGSMDMLQMPSDSSSQKVINVNLQTQEANTAVNIKSKDGKEILTYSPSKQYQSLVISTPDIKEGQTYEVSVGGEVTGEVTDGVYSNAKYSGGSIIGETKVEATISTINQEGISTNRGMHGNKGGKKRNMEQGSF